MSGSEAKWTFAQKFYVDFNVTASGLVYRKLHLTRAI